MKIIIELHDGQILEGSSDEFMVYSRRNNGGPVFVHDPFPKFMINRSEIKAALITFEDETTENVPSEADAAVEPGYNDIPF